MPGNYFAQPVFNESVSAVTLTPSVQLGAVRMENGEEYVYVYNDGGASAAVGALVVPASGGSGYSVTVTSVSGFDIAMGFVKHATFTTASYAWVLGKGYTTVINAMASTALTTSDLIMVGANGGVQVGVITGTSGGMVVGKMISATGSAGTGGRAYVRCFGV